jgi:phosphoglycolate phosphatase
MNPDTELPYKLLIFDWDGTLMDSQARIVNCLRFACLEQGLDDRSDDDYKNVIGLGLREAMRQLVPQASETMITALGDTYRYHFLVKDDTPSELFPGVVKLLQELEERGHWLAIATGKGREGLDQALTATGLQQHFHITRCASETRSKPHPQMLDEILQQLGVDAADALMIGDTEYDMEMAANAGMAGLAVSYGVHEAQRLLKHNPLDCLHHIDDLAHYLLSGQIG